MRIVPVCCGSPTSTGGRKTTLRHGLRDRHPVLVAVHLPGRKGRDAKPWCISRKSWAPRTQSPRKTARKNCAGLRCPHLPGIPSGEIRRFAIFPARPEPSNTKDFRQPSFLSRRSHSEERRSGKWSSNLRSRRRNSASMSTIPESPSTTTKAIDG